MKKRKSRIKTFKNWLLARDSSSRISSKSNYNGFFESDNKYIIMKHIHLFENFIKETYINEGVTKVDMKSDTKNLKLKDKFMSKIKKILGIESDNISKEKIIEIQKKKKIKADGVLNHATVLSILNKEPDKSIRDKEKSEKSEIIEIPGDEGPVKESFMNHINGNSYSLNEAEVNYLQKYSSQKNELLKFINSKIPSILPSINKKIDDAIPSSFSKCYTVDYLITEQEYCFSIGITIKITSFNINDIKLTTDSKYPGYVKGSVSGTVNIFFKVHLYGEEGIAVNFKLDITQTVWIYKFNQLQVYPPSINISTNWYDVGLVWAWIWNNKFKIKNSLMGEYEWALPIQSNVNKAFNDNGNPIIFNIAEEIKKYIKI